MLGYSLLVGVILQVSKIKTSVIQILMSNATLAIRETFMLIATNVRVTTIVWLYPRSETSHFSFEGIFLLYVFMYHQHL